MRERIKKMTNIHIEAENLLNKNYVNLNGKAKEFSKYDFCYYTSASTLNKILNTGKIWINSFDRMNDLNEAELHSNDKSDVFALCFCNTHSEKIPMWYLYGGICGDGMRIGLTPSNMLSFIRSIDKVYPIDENNVVSAVPIAVGEELTVSCGWIYYKKTDGLIKYKNSWYAVDNYGDFEKSNYYIKDYPWEYENEFRIVIKNNSSRQIERIAVDVPEFIIQKLKITCAPENSNFESIKLIKELEGFRKYPNNKITHSTLSIKMNLLSRNKESIVDNFKEIIDEKNADKIYNALRSTKYCKMEAQEE